MADSTPGGKVCGTPQQIVTTECVSKQKHMLTRKVCCGSNLQVGEGIDRGVFACFPNIPN